MSPIPDSIQQSITINAPASAVWHHLTTPKLMQQWMLDQDMEMEFYSDWKAGSPIVTKGKLHKIKFENQGTILQFEPEKVFEYTHLSSISRLPDQPENYCRLTFNLSSNAADETTLNLSVANFPTYSIYKHMEFYWRSAIVVLKRLVENM
jgi:uncharacterized protein YndB with AHSA1/START domain